MLSRPRQLSPSPGVQPHRAMSLGERVAAEAPPASLPKGKPSPKLAGRRGRRGNKRFVPDPDESVASRGARHQLGEQV